MNVVSLSTRDPLAFTSAGACKAKVRDDGAVGLNDSVLDMLGVCSEFETKHLPAAVEAHAVQRTPATWVIPVPCAAHVLIGAMNQAESSAQFYRSDAVG